MKKFGNYLRNPPKKKRRTKKRNARRNPAPFALTSINPAKRRGKKRRSNPVHRKKRRNPLQIQHVIADVPARNPSRRKKRRKAFSKSNRNPMSKKRKRRSHRSRNPVSHTRRRSHRRSRNPSRRRRARRSGIMSRLRNPAIISDVVNRKNIETGLGVLTGVVGTRWLVNKLIQGDPVTGVRMFDLPGIKYSTAAAPLTQAQFAATNKWMLAFYETAIPAVAGWLLRNKASALSEGLMQSAIVNVGIAAIRGTSVGTAAGMNAFLPRQRGMNTYIPGVPPMLSGPATSFITNGAPLPRNGMSATVNRQWHNRTVTGAANPFAK
jgi:hypothetical protein